ncbi:nuclear transport factor 2 family protein [Myxococcus qinghaiensis]|uniref:nuclear transport factor 2 family protein n=1 Tax=Myxococcus qinghaiensis TaxID=2906758 RepID=UPI0020A7A4C0|nr:nuclear transport factor 2 family protein [Myxococcus qinghaiensis]MCP3168781.1 nuclear transport factor 2 family protein [Myxococcus qinghaiensis]
MHRLYTAACAAALLLAAPSFAQASAAPAPATGSSAAKPQAPTSPATAPKPATPSPMKLAAEKTQAALQKAPQARPEDVKTQDGLLTALYDSISGPAGKPRDWQRFRSLFYPGAQMASVQRPKPGGAPGVAPITPDDYATWGEEFFKTRGFFEKETHRQVAGYGDLINVLSAYEARETPEGPPVTRGINNVQLIFDGQRWWVLHISWTDEKSAGAPVPASFTRK